MTQTPIGTAAVRVKELRKRTGRSAARLAEEMTNVGVPWKREIVANLESGRRDRLDVDELLALAAVFQVPPVALLIDPTSATTAVTPTLEMPTSHVLLWMLGELPLQVESGIWMDETVAVRLVRRLWNCMQRCGNAVKRRQIEEYRLATGRLEREDAEEAFRMQERELVAGLRDLSQVLYEMKDQGMPVPPIAEDPEITALAAERGLTLGEPPSYPNMKVVYEDGTVVYPVEVED